MKTRNDLRHFTVQSASFHRVKYV